MTTKVKIEAHCVDDKEIVVSINSENTGDEYTLKDGESGEWVVYDDLKITVNERASETKSILNTSHHTGERVHNLANPGADKSD